MCIYTTSKKQPPYPRVGYDSECGFYLAIMEGYEHDTYKDSNGKEAFSAKSDRINLPKGKCMKCGELITNQ